jgi:hypothetical protein
MSYNGKKAIDKMKWLEMIFTDIFVVFSFVDLERQPKRSELLALQAN